MFFIFLFISILYVEKLIVGLQTYFPEQILIMFIQNVTQFL